MFLMLMCFALQFAMLQSVWSAEVSLKDMNGTPHLCSYGSDTGASTTPRGPWGGAYKRDRANIESDYQTVVLLNTLAEHSKRLDGASDIEPVEFGMESATCRLVCVTVLIAAVMGKVSEDGAMVRILLHTPTLYASHLCAYVRPGIDSDGTQDSWITFEDDYMRDLFKDDFSAQANQIQIKAVSALWKRIGKDHLDHISFQVNGMPWYWKAWAFFIVSLRVVLFAWFFSDCIPFVMNSAGIVETVLNSLALVFVIDLDIVFFTTFCTPRTKKIMKRLQCDLGEPYLPENRIHKGEYKYTWGQYVLKCWKVSWKVLLLMVAVLVTHYIYFAVYCEMVIPPLTISDIGRPYFDTDVRWLGGWELLFGYWISKPVHSDKDGSVTCIPQNGDRQASGCGMPGKWNYPWN
jgi:hypothetical protein